MLFFYVIALAVCVLGQNYGDNVVMTPNDYASALKLSDAHHNVILERTEVGRPWKLAIGFFVGSNHEYTHDSNGGTNPLHWIATSAFSAVRRRELKLQLSADNHYFMGFTERNVDQYPAVDDEDFAESFGFDDNRFIFFPNRYTIKMLFDTARDEQHSIIALKRTLDADTWKHIGDPKNPHYEYVHPKEAENQEANRVWYRYSIDDNEPTKKQKQVLVMTEIDGGGFQHSWESEREVIVPVQHVSSDGLTLPYRNNQVCVGDCVLVSLNNILGGKYWTNIQYYKENVKAYGDEMNSRKWWPPVGKKYEAFQPISVKRALAKVQAHEKGIKCSTIATTSMTKPKVLGVRYSYGFSKKAPHSVAFRWYNDAWWFIQSSAWVTPKRFRTVGDMIQQMKIIGDGVCYLVTLYPGVQKLITPTRINRDATYEFTGDNDAIGFEKTEQQTRVRSPPEKEAQAYEDYYNLLMDYQYDVAFEKARANKAHKLLNEDKKKFLRAKNRHRKQYNNYY